MPRKAPDGQDAWPDPDGGSDDDELRSDTEHLDLATIRVCTLYAAEAQAAANQLRLMPCSAYPTLHGLMQFETQVLTSVFGVRPAFTCFDDAGGANAFATTAPLLGSADGTVMFGVRLLMSETRSNLAWYSWGTAVIGIMAHEWAHVRQFAAGLQHPGKPMELHADFMAGWFLGWKAANDARFDLGGFERSLFGKGDYNFNHPQHHGTPEERAEAMDDGFSLAVLHTVGLAPGSMGLRQAFEEAFEEGWGQFGL